MTPPTPQELFDSCVPLAHKFAGDFVRRHRHRLHTIGLEPADVAQDALAALHRSALKWRPGECVKFTTYCFPALRNAMASLAGRFRGVPAVSSADLDRHDPRAACPSGQAAERDHAAHVRAAVRRALNDLPAAQRAVVQGRMAGLNTRAIARREGVSVAVVKKRITDANRVLKSSLAPFAPKPRFEEPTHAESSNRTPPPDAPAPDETREGQVLPVLQGPAGVVGSPDTAVPDVQPRGDADGDPAAGLTPELAEVYRVIRREILTAGVAPTMRAICEELNVSPATMSGRVQALHRRKVVKLVYGRNSRRVRTILLGDALQLDARGAGHPPTPIAGRRTPARQVEELDGPARRSADAK